MSDGGMVRGVVVDCEGRAVAQATIVVVNGTAPVPEIALVADDAGRFGLRLPHGRFTLEAQGYCGSKGRMTIEIAGSSQKIEIQVKSDE